MEPEGVAAELDQSIAEGLDAALVLNTDERLQDQESFAIRVPRRGTSSRMKPKKHKDRLMVVRGRSSGPEVMELLADLSWLGKRKMPDRVVRRS